jgi:hypothetical protein
MNNIARNNHFVPVWYQKRFLFPGNTSYFYLDLNPPKKDLGHGNIITLNDCYKWGPKKCFKIKDLYTISLFGVPFDEIERYLFGAIDKLGCDAIQAFVDNDVHKLYHLFLKLFEYIDIQKIRTPKGLDWIKNNYPDLPQLQLMYEMQKLSRMNCTMWIEAVREVISAEESDVKFIITDHPVTVYNPACPLDSNHYKYPNDPAISLKGSQTIFPLDLNNCLILTNLEYAKDPKNTDLLSKRTYARNYGQTITKYTNVIRKRKLKTEDVTVINYILKKRASKYIAGGKKEFLCPESTMIKGWDKLREITLPPQDELWQFGGKIYVGYKNGSTYYQDEFGRTTPEEHLIKSKYTIRERNMMLYNAVTDMLGLSKGKTWEDVQKQISNKQVSNIYGFFGWLWPKETDIIALLPKPDTNKIRAIYTGIIDPRTILSSVVGLSMYFDEILMINPFVNPNCVSKEYNPVKSPDQYKQDTLKNIFLIMEIMPFIEAGIINLIPNPCDFNYTLRTQIMEMAKSRLKNWKPDPVEKEIHMKLFEQDYKNVIYGMPEDALKRYIKSIMTESTDKEITDLVAYMKRKREKDPFAVLQPLKPGIKEGQLTGYRVLPNFELGLYLAQITGSFICTDNRHRWSELTNSVAEGNNIDNSYWNTIIEYLSKIDFTIELNPYRNMENRQTEEFEKMRSVLRHINRDIQSVKNPIDIKSLNKRYPKALRKANKSLRKKWKIIKKNIRNSKISSSDPFSFIVNAKFKIKIPVGGFGITSVYRLLVSSGIADYLKSVPMIMFISLEDVNDKFIKRSIVIFFSLIKRIFNRLIVVIVRYMKRK